MASFEHLRSVKQIAEANPAFTEPSLRWLIFNAQSNGMNSALVRVGRRVLIDVQAFNAWLEEGRGRPMARMPWETKTQEP
ncbi:MAG: DNA-binding protein [bacterium]|nr:DNA-binding protein [bacterium]